jgi:hypothetical protein
MLFAVHPCEMLTFPKVIEYYYDHSRVTSLLIFSTKNGNAQSEHDLPALNSTAVASSAYTLGKTLTLCALHRPRAKVRGCRKHPRVSFELLHKSIERYKGRMER